jgi:choline-sulfatase
MSARRLLAAAAIVAIAAFAVMWLRAPGRSREAAIASGSCRGCNVLLVTIDTLRMDRVGAFGGRAGLTPAIDRLAAEGVRLTRAYASAPLTLPSHASILTAVPPPVHGLRTNGLYRLGPNLPTLATVLGQAGYRTGAFVGSFVLDARFGLNRGFDVYDDRYGEKHAGDPAEGAERRAEDVVRPALDWILSSTEHRAPSTEHRNKWFAWIHLYDPHEPYRAPEPYASQHEPYDAEVAYTDATLGRFLDRLRAAGALDRTLVVVAADHGESLGEHGERTHGVFVYDVTMRVPWIVWSAGIAHGEYGGLARLVDLAPTVLDIAGVDRPSAFEGRSLLPAMGGGEAPASAYLEAMDANLTRNWAPLTAIVAGGDKLIDLPQPELYHLQADPAETRNVFNSDAERARTLAALLRQETAGFAARGSAAEKTTLSAESRQRLQALGYVASSADPGQRTYTDADDPKTLIGPANDLQRAVVAFNRGDRGAAMSTVRGIIASHPAFATAHGVLASMQRESGNLRGAIATLEALVRQGIADPAAMVVLAGYLQEAGAPEKAIALLEAVIASRPDYAEAYNSLGVVCMRTGQHARARAAFQKVVDLDPTSAKAFENLGEDKLAAGDIAGAIPDLQRALDLDPQLWDALYNLSLALDALGRRDEARPLVERFLREAPADRYSADRERLRHLLAAR